MKSVLTYLKSLFTHKDVFFKHLYVYCMGQYVIRLHKRNYNHLPLLYQYTDQVIIAIVVIPLFLSIPLLINKFTLFDYSFFCISYSHLRKQIMQFIQKIQSI